MQSPSEICTSGQTVELLEQLKAQLSCCIEEWDSHASEMVSLFSSVAEEQNQLDVSLRGVAISEESKQLLSSILYKHRPFMQELQFHDRLNQRMDHIRTSVGMLQKLLKDQESRKLPSEWAQLLETIAECAAMETDRRRFGMSENHSPSGDIDLF